MNPKKAAMVTILLVCAWALTALGLLAGEQNLQEHWRGMIVSPEGSDRMQAEKLFLEDRRATVSALLQVLDLPVRPDEPFYTGSPRNSAIKLLGELRAPEAVPALTQWLVPRPGQSGVVDGLMYLSPAGYALVKIGMPAVPAVVDILASVGVTSEDKGEYIHELRGGVGYTRHVGPRPERYSPLGDDCLRILVQIKGLEETEAGLRRYIAAETGETRKKNLEEALSALSRPSLREGFLNIQAQDEARDGNQWRGWWKKQEGEQARKKARQPQPEPQPAPPAR